MTKILRQVLLFALSVALPAAAQIAAKPEILLPYTGPRAQANAPGVRSQAIPIRLNVAQLRAMARGAEARLALPDGRLSDIVLDLAQDHGNGISSWIGHFKTRGIHNRVIITSGPNGSFGVIETPVGTFRIVPGQDHDWLVDMIEEDYFVPPMDLGDDGVPIPPQAKVLAQPAYEPTVELAIPGVNTVAAPKATPTPQHVVDIMFVVTQGLANKLGPNLMTRLNFLVTRANTAYADSEVAITLRLVYATVVNYTDSPGDLTALNAITPVSGGGVGVFSSVESLRSTYGADLVSLLRDGSDYGGSGIAWVGKPPSASYMYSVVTGCVQGCESVFIHELGHNMGNVHDRGTAARQAGGRPLVPSDSGASAYSYGYAFCITGALSCNPELPPGSGGCAAATGPQCSTNDVSNFSDIMAYFHTSTERIYKFSNPDIMCAATSGDGVPRLCGVNDAAANSANTALSMNGTRAAVSAIRAAVAAASLPGSLQFTASSYSAAESAGNIALTVSRIGGSAGVVTVGYATSNGSALAGLDFTNTPGTLIWADGDTANKTINIPIANDGVNENGEAFTVTLSGPTGPAGVFVGYPGTATAIIVSTWPAGGVLSAGFLTPDGSAGAWTTATDRVFEGTTSLRSAQVFGNYPTYTNSDLSYTGMFETGVVSFAYNVSSWANPGFVQYGIFEFSVDGTVVKTDAGESGWLSFSHPISAGTHTLRWRFRNAITSACSGGWSPPAPGGAACADRAWIDALVLPLTLANSATSLVSSVNPATFGQPVTFTATTNGASGTPVGIAVFYDGATPIAGCASVALSSGVATCITSALSAGVHSISAVYSGNEVYNSSPSNIVTLVVNAAKVTGDMNADGRSDLLWRNAADGSVQGWLMNALSATSVAGLLPAGGYTVTHTGDLDGDGRADLLVRHTDGTVIGWLMNGLGVTSSSTLVGAGSGWSIAKVADLDGDGKSDLVWQHTDGTVQAWLMNGLGVASVATFVGAGSGWSASKVADLNGDGKADIIWQHSNGTVQAWLMNGLSVSSIASFAGAGSGWSVVLTGDMDGDGKADLVWQHTNGTTQAWIMNGLTVTQLASFTPAATGWAPILAGDIDGDGKADLFWQHTGGASQTWLMNGVAVSNLASFVPGGTGWSATHVMDLNGDGRRDVLWQHTSGAVQAWLMNGLSISQLASLTGAGTFSVVPASP